MTATTLSGSAQRVPPVSGPSSVVSRCATHTGTIDISITTVATTLTIGLLLAAG